jgi:5'-3' exonuclease
MGIKHFFFWYKKNFTNSITSLEKNQTLPSINKPIDTLLLDLNGIFHNSAQKIFKYGNFSQPKRLLGNPIVITNDKETRELLYQDVCDAIDHLVTITQPRKRIFLGIDGPAPIGKQNQQRQRRFRAASESRGGEVFDSNCITPGTEFMHELGIYIDKHIRGKLETDNGWRDRDVVFSNEKVPGEGEHKAVEYIREKGTSDEIYCINGPDADLIMLALATHKTNFYVLREDTFDPKVDMLLLDMTVARQNLIKMMRWNSPNHTFNEKQVIDDFIFVCFMVGNDFLPHIPSIEIIESGIELMLDITHQVGVSNGHITQTTKNGKVTFRKEALTMFLETIGTREKTNLEQKLAKKKSFFPDPILLKYASNNSTGAWSVDIDEYINEYNSVSFASTEIQSVCHQYIQGLQWVLTYYTTGCPSWKWYFPYQYAPTASTLKTHVETVQSVKYGNTKPSTPFQQLLSVLPPKSAKLIPSPLDKLLTDETSPLREFCPDKLVIDITGKRKEWEGITILPMVDQVIVSKLCKKHVPNVNTIDLERNVHETPIVY